MKVNKHWRAAWLRPEGIEVVESSDDEPLSATSSDRLWEGDDASKLQFTDDGTFLILFRQPRFSDPVSVLIWDMRDRKSLAQSAQAPGPDELVALKREACRLVLRDKDVTKDELEALDIQKNPCPSDQLKAN